MIELTLIAEMVLVAIFICGLYELRGRFGLTPLYIFLAATQYLQALLGGAVFLHILGGIAVSPGSVVLFAGNLFALLLIYLREGVPATRTLVYGLILANFTLGIFSYITQWQVSLAGPAVTQIVPFEFFGVSYRAFGVGVFVMLLDGLLMIVLYELLFFQLTWAPLFVRLLVALLGVLYFDSVIFGVLSYWGRPDFSALLTGNMAGKSMAGVTYAILRANISLAHVVSPTAITVKTWERGAGITKACGTAACAVAVAAARKGLTGRHVTVTLPGGSLDIDWRADEHVWMTGPVATEFEGTLDPESLRWEASARGAA